VFWRWALLGGSSAPGDGREWESRFGTYNTALPLGSSYSQSPASHFEDGALDAIVNLAHKAPIASDGRDNAELGKMGADRIDHRSLLADEQVAGAMEHQTAYRPAA
jgi:hypothetical protein